MLPLEKSHNDLSGLWEKNHKIFRGNIETQLLERRKGFYRSYYGNDLFACLSRSDQGEETPHGKLNLTFLLRANAIEEKVVILRIVAIKLKQLLVYWMWSTLSWRNTQKNHTMLKRNMPVRVLTHPPPPVTVSKGNFPENKTDFVLSNNKKEISLAAPSNH